MTHVDQKHHVTRVTLDCLTKVTAMTTIFNALPGSRDVVVLSDALNARRQLSHIERRRTVAPEVDLRVA